MSAGAPTPIRVAIVDDHLMVRSGLRQYFGEFSDIAWVGEAADGVEALELLARTRVDVVLLDLSMPRRTGLEVLPEIRDRYPATRVVVLSGYPPAEFEPRVTQLGAVAYLHKECEPLAIITAVRVAGAGRDNAANDSPGS